MAQFQSKRPPSLVIVVHVVLGAIILVVRRAFRGASSIEMGADIKSPDILCITVGGRFRMQRRLAPILLLRVLGWRHSEFG